jgi:hypothetical protein
VRVLRLATLINKLLCEALAFHVEKPVRFIEGTENSYVADYSERAVELLAGLGMIQVQINERNVISFKDNLVVHLN